MRQLLRTSRTSPGPRVKERIKTSDESEVHRCYVSFSDVFGGVALPSLLL